MSRLPNCHCLLPCELADAEQCAFDKGLAAFECNCPSHDFDFDGATYVSEFDRERLRGQWLRVYALMQDGQWRTLAEISAATGDPQASISARLRDFRKERFGSHTVNRRTRGDRANGLFEYQLIVHDQEVLIAS